MANGRRLCLLLILAFGVSASELLQANDHRILYIGRTMVSPSNRSVRLLDWAGVHACVSFQGTALTAHLQGGSKRSDRFLLVLDGVASTPFMVASGDFQEYHLAGGLEDTHHTAQLWRISEDNTWDDTKGATHFAGFSLPAGGTFLEAPLLPQRRLEFWGDSNTAGWCADGKPSGKDTPQAPVQNTYSTWAAQMARELDASFAAEAISGIGVTENSQGGAIIDYIDYAATFAAPKWNYSMYAPDAIIFWLGLNDAHPRSATFRTAYSTLMEHAAKKYSSAPAKPKLIHVCGSLNDGSIDACGSIQQAIETFNKGRTDGFRSFYTAIEADVWKAVSNDQSYHGCDAHYNFAGHKLVKDNLLPQISSIMGWGKENIGFVV